MPSRMINGLNYDPPRTATYVVAASDSPAHVKAQADDVCSGTADQVNIQAAINALPVRGGVVYLPAGNYYISSHITIPRYVSLIGEGKYSTIIRAAANMTRMIYTATGVLNDRITIKSLCLNGQGATRDVRYGIEANNLLTSLIDDVFIWYMNSVNQGAGIFLREAGMGFFDWLNRITNVDIQHVGPTLHHGMRIDSTDNYLSAIEVSVHDHQVSTGQGYYLIGSGNVLINCRADHYANGFLVTNLGPTNLIGGVAEHCTNSGFNIQGGGGKRVVTITGNHCYENGVHDVYGEATGVAVVGNIFQSGGAVVNSILSFNSNFWVVIGNVCAKTISLTGANNQNANNVVNH